MPKITIEYEDGKIVTENCTDFILGAMCEEGVLASFEGNTLTHIGLLKVLDSIMQSNFTEDIKQVKQKDRP